MFGAIFITSSGYDPELGRHVKDPYLGKKASLGACRPDIRKAVDVGDHVFTISGKLPGRGLRDVPQYVMGGFEVAAKIHANDAYHEFPEQRLRKLPDGQLTGNVIVNSRGRQHRLDQHDGFERRLPNYLVGTKVIALETQDEINRGRSETVDALSHILKKCGRTPKEIVGRWGCRLTAQQVTELRTWLNSIKEAG
jgi:hypothetical protein